MNTPSEVRRTLIGCTAESEQYEKLGTTNLREQILSGEYDLNLGRKSMCLEY